MLPSAFQARMERLLGPEYAAFAASFDQPRTHGLRVNTLKLTPAELQAKLGLPLEPVPWAPSGFYFPEDVRPGIHPFHAAGLFYIQEPSAMSAAEALAPEPGERVLDLCAAPGGKATHLAALMTNQGLLVANEIHPGRARILAENVERFGIACAAVTQEEPDRLAARFPGFFDRILADAPCSGEGMFRKLPEAVAEWTPESPAACACRQEEEVLPAAVAMLKPGGHLLYSTCTFAPEENEEQLLKLLRRFPALEVVALPEPLAGQLAPGRPEWAADPTAAEAEAIRRAGRLWPHLLRGEGHFLVLLRKAGTVESEAVPARASSLAKKGKGPSPLEAGVALFREFAQAALTTAFDGPYELRGEELYQVPPALPDMAGLRVLRPGLHLGTVKKHRFEPAHALALALRASHARHTRDLPADGPEVRAYLRGETLPADGQEGWTLITVAGYPLGWAKAAAGILKNHYPKGLRWPG